MNIITPKNQKPLPFDPESIETAISDSETLLPILVPGNCLAKHVLEFCKQAPIAKYMAAACSEENPWSGTTSRKFVRRYRNKKITPKIIIRMAYLTTHGRQPIPNLNTWLSNFNTAVLDDLKFDFNIAISGIERALVTGNFGILNDHIKQNEHRRITRDMLNQSSATIERITRACYERSGKTGIHSDPISLQCRCWHTHNCPDRHDLVLSYKTQILSEFAEYAILREDAIQRTEDEIFDIWNVSLYEILEAAFNRAKWAQDGCHVFNIPFESTLPLMDDLIS